VYVADAGNSRVQVFTAFGIPLAEWGSRGTGPGQFRSPSDVAVDAAGHVYVMDMANNRVQVFGRVPTAVQASSWGRIKALYR
jgi:tripartite motif-containing protein 71